MGLDAINVYKRCKRHDVKGSSSYTLCPAVAVFQWALWISMRRTGSNLYYTPGALLAPRLKQRNDMQRASSRSGKARKRFWCRQMTKSVDISYPGPPDMVIYSAIYIWFFEILSNLSVLLAGFLTKTHQQVGRWTFQQKTLRFLSANCDDVDHEFVLSMALMVVVPLALPICCSAKGGWKRAISRGQFWWFLCQKWMALWEVATIFQKEMCVEKWWVFHLPSSTAFWLEDFYLAKVTSFDLTTSSNLSLQVMLGNLGQGGISLLQFMTV